MFSAVSAHSFSLMKSSNFPFGNLDGSASSILSASLTTKHP